MPADYTAKTFASNEQLTEYARHIDYIHFNPVKLSHVKNVRD